MKTVNKESRLAFFSELYENAKGAQEEYFELLDRHMRQYKGSDEIDYGHERASTVRNITYEIIESQVSSDIPVTKIDPYTYSERTARCADAAKRLCTAVRAHLPFEAMNDLDERYTYIYGGSVWFVEWNNAQCFGTERGGVEIKCISPKDFIPQPGITEVEDMEYCFLHFTTTRSEICRRYGIDDAIADRLECEYSFGSGYTSGDAVSEIVCFWRDEFGEIGRYAFSGDVELSDIESYYKRKHRVCTVCGKDEALCTCKSPVFQIRNKELEALECADLISLGADFSGTRTTVPYYTPRRFPIVIRKNTTTDELVLGQSDCEFIRPEQQAINKIESRILQKLLRAGITPVMPEDSSVTLGNSVFGQVIKMRPGESIDQYGKIDTTPDISQDIREAERLYEHAKRTLGISDAFQGVDTDLHESGVAKQLRISQANNRLESKRKMKYTAYAEIDRLIFEHYLAFADDPMQISYKDAYGNIHSEQWSRHAFLEVDTRSGELFYNDAFLFSVDLNSATDFQREELWARNLENLRAGTLGDTASPVTLLRYWQCQERAHYPYARENVEYFALLVEKKNKESENEKQKD